MESMVRMVLRGLRNDGFTELRIDGIILHTALKLKIFGTFCGGMESIMVKYLVFFR